MSSPIDPTALPFLLISGNATEWIVWVYASAQIEARDPDTLEVAGTVLALEADFTDRGLVQFVPTLPPGGE